MKKKLIDAALVARARSALNRGAAMNFFTKTPPKAEGRPDTDWYKIFRNAKTDEAEILIYDEIGFWGVTASNFVQELKEIEESVINVRINSPGGSVFDGVAIYNALAQHNSKIVVHVDGWAASIASVIAMAGDEILISEVAQFMIHKPWSFVVGTDEDMIKEAEVLKSLESSIVDIYVARTGGDRTEIEAWVKAETWFKGKDAVAKGFADKLVPLVNTEDEKKPAARLPADFFACIFPNMPHAVRSAVAAAQKPGTETGGGKIDFNKHTPRTLEAALREMGASAKQAKQLIAEGFKSMSSEEDTDEETRARDERERATQESRDANAKKVGEAADAIRQLATTFQVVAATVRAPSRNSK